MNPDERPNPDELLRAIQEEEKRTALGKLKIFFGMSAGVGKTYTMLEEAHQRLHEGIRLVVGTINTHGRLETEKVLEGLPILPEKWVEFKGKAFQELDLEKILETKPQLVLIDELAHTNVPGSKHAKRWQDVIEILDAGIDVYTTLNVQHLESRKDLVESITGISMHETVPDLVLERATAIEIVDITPLELLQRLKEGKVYLGDQSTIAAENFFKEDNLTALREIALRFTAEKVEHDLHSMMALGKGWKTRERIMVAISPAYSSQQLIRLARRQAFELDAPWIAVYIDTGIKLDAENQAKLNQNMQLAQELGAEVITVSESDISSGLQKAARQNNVTRLVIGRPTERTFFERVLKKSFLEQLEEDNKQMDILILRQDKLLGIYQRSFPTFHFKSPAVSYFLSVGMIAVATLLGYFIAPFSGYKAVGFIYLITILILSLFVGQGPVFVGAFLSALSWDFLFIPPQFTPYISDPEDIALVATYFLTALTVGLLTSRNRKKDLTLTRKEERLENLYDIGREIAKSPNLESLRLNVTNKLKTLFGADFDIFCVGGNNQLSLESSSPLSETDRSAALWCYQNGKTAGWSTDTLPSAESLFLPIISLKKTLGVLRISPKSQTSFSKDEIDFLKGIAGQIGIYLEGILSLELEQSHHYMIQVEKLHNAIFRSLSKGFYVPLEKMSQSIEKLSDSARGSEEKNLFHELFQSQKNLKMIVDNILMISRLESGFVKFEKKKNSINELLNKSLEESKGQINDHPISIVKNDEEMFFDFDFDLMKTAIKNLLINAMEYSPVGSPIEVQLEILETEFKISVIDSGPGIPSELIPYIFEKFYRLPGAQYEGIGLGLTIVKDIMALHQGKMEVNNHEGKGTIFSLILPKS